MLNKLNYKCTLTTTISGMFQQCRVLSLPEGAHLVSVAPQEGLIPLQEAPHAGQVQLKLAIVEAVTAVQVFLQTSQQRS